MTQANVVELNKMTDLIELVDTASKFAKQAEAALVALTVNEELQELNTKTKNCVLWAVTDRLEDLEKLFDSWHESEIAEQSLLGSKLAGQARGIILAYQDNGIIDDVNPEIFSNALWFVRDRIEDILKLTNQIKVK